MLRWAILGTGFISKTMIGAVEQSDGSEVVLVAGRRVEAVVAFQEEFGIARGIVGYEDAVVDPEVDAVYIGLPNHKHHELSVAAAAAGKAVLSEKSLTTTMATAEELIDGVQNHGAFFVEGLMYLAHPLYQRVTELLLDGRLGTIRSISGRYAANIWQVVNPDGKGTLYNLGCYPASLLHLVIQTAFGEEAFSDRTIAAVGNTNDDNSICDAAVSIRFGNGVLATLQSSDSYGNGSEFAITGDRGMLRFETNPWLPEAGDNVLTFHRFDDDAEPETIVVSDPQDAFYHQTKLVERCVAQGLTEAPRPSPRHRDSLEIMGLLTEWEAACHASVVS
jgi:predicted dehydrogenase